MTKLILFSCFYLVIKIIVVRTTHFAGGSISWKAFESNSTNMDNITIELQQTYSWMNSLSNCNSIGGPNDTLSWMGYFCSNASGITTRGKCISYDIYFNFTTTKSTQYFQCAVNKLMLLMYYNHKWSSVVNNFSPYNNSLVTLIDLKVRSKTGQINSSPITSMLPVITLPINTMHIIRIPMIDTDGDIVKCRWANQSTSYYLTNINECGSVCNHYYLNAQLYTTSNFDNNCTLVVNLSLANYYAVAIQIEDFLPSAPYYPLSSIPLQFVIRGTNNDENLPKILGEFTNGAIITVPVSTPFSASIMANTSSGQKPIVKFSTDIVPLGVTSTSSIITHSSTVYSTIFTWIPTVDQIGIKQLYCTIAIDSENKQSAQYCLNFIVVEKIDSPTKSESNDIGVLLGLSLGLGLPLFLLIIFTTGYYIYSKYSTRKIGQQKVFDMELSNTVGTRTENLRSVHEQANTSFPNSMSADSNEFQSNSMNMTRSTFAPSITKSLLPIGYASTVNGNSDRTLQHNGNSTLIQTYFGQTSLENSRLSNWND